MLLKRPFTCTQKELNFEHLSAKYEAKSNNAGKINERAYV